MLLMITQTSRDRKVVIDSKWRLEIFKEHGNFLTKFERKCLILRLFSQLYFYCELSNIELH